MSVEKDPLLNLTQPKTVESQENEYLYQKRPLTSYGKSSSNLHLHHGQSSGQLQPLAISNHSGLRGAIQSPKQQQQLYGTSSIKASRSGNIRPSTVSSQYHQPSALFAEHNKRAPHIGQQNLLKYGQNEFFGNKPDRTSAKKIPNNILHDKEMLYESQRQLKNTVNQLQEDNLKLRTRNTNLEREAKKFERIIEEGNQSNQQSGAQQPLQQKENALSIRLRKQLKECIKEVEIKTLELENFKRSITTTRQQELEIQVKIGYEEIYRLKSKLEQCLRVNSDDQGIEGGASKQGDGMLSLSKKVEGLKNDNLEMAVLIQKLEKEKNEIAVQARESDRQLKKMLKERVFLLKQVQQEEEEIRRLRNNANDENGINGAGSPYKKNSSLANNQNNLAEYNQKLKADLDKLAKENSKLNNQLIVKVEKVKDLEDKQRRDNQEWQERLESMRVQKELAEKSLNSELLLSKSREDRIKELEEQLSRSENQEGYDPSEGSQEDLENKDPQQNSQQGNNPAIHLVTASSNQNGRSPVSSQTGNGIKPEKSEIKKKKAEIQQKKFLSRVNQEDVSKIGRDIRFALLTQGIKFEDIDRLLLQQPEFKKKGKVSINEVTRILLKEPFNVSKQEDALQVARYTIEDNSEDKIQFDENRSNDLSVVKTVFRNLIGKYEIFTRDQELKLYEDIAKLFTQQQQGLKQNIEYFRKQSKVAEEGVCRLEDFYKSMSEYDAGISNRHMDYITMQIYKDSHDTDKVYYLRLLKTFSLSEFAIFQQQNQLAEEGHQMKEEEAENQNHLNNDNQPIQQLHQQEHEAVNNSQQINNLPLEEGKNNMSNSHQLQENGNQEENKKEADGQADDLAEYQEDPDQKEA